MRCEPLGSMLLPVGDGDGDAASDTHPFAQSAASLSTMINTGDRVPLALRCRLLAGGRCCGGACFCLKACCV
jgi:hypothetical protein